MELVDIGPRGWVEAVPVFVALLDSGTPEGKRQARDYLRRMARVADLGVLAVQRLVELDDKGFTCSPIVQASGLRLDGSTTDGSASSQTELGLDEFDPARSSSNPAAIARIASRTLGRSIPLEVCYSARGFYLGTCVDDAPYSRESVEYWTRREAAETALASGRWTQRPQA